MRKISLFLSATSLFLLTSFGLMQQVFAADLIYYENVAYGIALEYPGNWELEEVNFGDEIAYIWAPWINDYPARVMVGATALPFEYTLDQYVAEAFYGLDTLSNFQFISEEYTSLSGSEAYMVAYSFTLDGVELIQVQVHTVLVDRAYFLIFSVSPEDFDTFLSDMIVIAESIEIFGTYNEGSLIYYDEPASAIPLENESPKASFYVKTREPTDLLVELSAENSKDPDGEIARYHWTFGDGQSAKTVDPFTEHNYEKAADYTITLTVYDEQGKFDMHEDDISITPMSTKLTNDLMLYGTIGGGLAAVAASAYKIYVTRKHKRKSKLDLA